MTASWPNALASWHLIVLITQVISKYFRDSVLKSKWNYACDNIKFFVRRLVTNRGNVLMKNCVP